MCGLPGPWSLLGSAVLAASPLYLFTSLWALSDVPATAWATAAVIAALEGRERPGWALVSGRLLLGGLPSEAEQLPDRGSRRSRGGAVAATPWPGRPRGVSRGRGLDGRQPLGLRGLLPKRLRRHRQRVPRRPRPRHARVLREMAAVPAEPDRRRYRRASWPSSGAGPGSPPSWPHGPPRTSASTRRTAGPTRTGGSSGSSCPRRPRSSSRG